NGRFHRQPLRKPPAAWIPERYPDHRRRTEEYPCSYSVPPLNPDCTSRADLSAQSAAIAQTAIDRDLTVTNHQTRASDFPDTFFALDAAFSDFSRFAGFDASNARTAENNCGYAVGFSTIFD